MKIWKKQTDETRTYRYLWVDPKKQRHLTMIDTWSVCHTRTIILHLGNSYKCITIWIVNLSTSITPCTMRTISFIQDRPSPKPPMLAAQYAPEHRNGHTDWQHVVLSATCASIWLFIMTVFVLNTMPVNAYVQGALSNVLKCIIKYY